MHVFTWRSVSQLCSITFIPGFIPCCLYWFSITLDQIPVSLDVNRICCEQKKDINNIVQEKRNEQHQELRSLLALEEKQLSIAPSTLHYPTPTPSTLHYPTPPFPSLPSQLSKVCEISRPSYAVAFSGGFQERHTSYQQPTKSKVHVPQKASVFPLYSHKMQ